jgi:nudix-type nucleoside diphosphatase (YffH/AdpP family)
MKARPAKAPPIPAHPGLDVRSDEVVWDGRFPLQRVRFTYTRFDGAPSAELTWELWRRGGGVAVLPYDPAADAVALIQQFRLPALAAGLDPVMTECAAGLLERGEDPEAAARRELAEETGLRAGRMERIGRYMLMQGGCDEVMVYYAARVALPRPDAAGMHGLAQEGEDIRVLVLPAEEVFALLDANRIENVTAAVCLYWLRQHRARLRREWG